MNNAVFYFFYSFAHKSVLVDQAAVIAALYLPFIVAFLAFVYLIFFRRSLRDLVFVFFAAGLAGAISKLLKILIHTPRPPVVLEGVQSLFEKTTYAFPSDHATFFMALAIAIFFLNKKAGVLFMVFALVIGVARIVVGVHFPVDILGGFALGAIVSLLVAFFTKKI
jgi:undecaprenyl-diphosphatase